MQAQINGMVTQVKQRGKYVGIVVYDMDEDFSLELGTGDIDVSKIPLRVPIVISAAIVQRTGRSGYKYWTATRISVKNG